MKRVVICSEPTCIDPDTGKRRRRVIEGPTATMLSVPRYSPCWEHDEALQKQLSRELKVIEIAEAQEIRKTLGFKPKPRRNKRPTRGGAVR